MIDYLSKTQSPDEYNFKHNNGIPLSLFTTNLFKLDSRIRICELYGDIEEDSAYIPLKNLIIIPCVFPEAIHQIAHMVEMKDLFRITKRDWGMTTNRLLERKAKNFFACLSREIRVRAIQLHMFDDARNKEESIAYNILKSNTWNDPAKLLLPFGRFKSYQDLETWVADLREKTYNAWSLDRIKIEWEVKLAHLQEWMETKETVNN